MKKRSGITFIEMIVAMLIMSILIFVMLNIFQLTFEAYQFNRKIAAQLYSQSNVDNVFSTIEKELLFAGSMSEVLEHLPEFNTNEYFKITGPSTSVTINSQYALAEKIIITKKYKNEYPSIDIPSQISEEDYEKTYFALFESEFPKADSTNTKWAVEFDDIASINNATIINISNSATLNVTLDGIDNTAVQIDAKTKTGTTINSTDLALYISPLLYEKALNGSMPIELPTSSGSKKKWYGEMIYNSTLTLDASDIKLIKYIPTLDVTYEIILMDNVLSFEASKSTYNSIFTATLTYLIPDIKDTNPVTVSRRFLNP